MKTSAPDRDDPLGSMLADLPRSVREQVAEVTYGLADDHARRRDRPADHHIADVYTALAELTATRRRRSRARHRLDVALADLYRLDDALPYPRALAAPLMGYDDETPAGLALLRLGHALEDVAIDIARDVRR